MSETLKNILVPTDFSENSRYAVKAAVKLAQRIKGQILLYHRIDLPPNWDAATEEQKSFNTRALKRDQKMREDFERILSEYLDSDIRINFVHSAGDLFENIEELVEIYEIDFVVMGSEGAKGVMEWYIGSNAERISDTLNVPVLIIKQAFEEFPLEQVVFASEFRDEVKKPFLELVDLLHHFGSTIHLLYIHSINLAVNQEVLDRMQEFKSLCSPLPCFIHAKAGHKVELGVQSFTENIQADLLCLVHQHKEPFEKLMKGSVSKKLINLLTCPVLSIPLSDKALEIS